MIPKMQQIQKNFNTLLIKTKFFRFTGIKADSTLMTVVEAIQNFIKGRTGNPSPFSSTNRFFVQKKKSEQHSYYSLVDFSDDD